jgi:hypothetical protein
MNSTLKMSSYTDCLYAVSKNGLALELVPRKFMNLRMYTTAVINNSIAFKFIPDEHKTDDLYRLASRNMGILGPNPPKDIILCQMVQYGLVGLNPTLQNEQIFIKSVKIKPELLSLYDGDRLKVWIKAGYPSMKLDTLFSEWDTYNDIQKNFLINGVTYLVTQQKSFLESYPEYADMIPKNWKTGLRIFSVQSLSDAGHIKNMGLASTLLNLSDAKLDNLMKMDLQWFYF